MPALHRPSPLQRAEVQPVDRDGDPAFCAAALINGVELVVADHFHTGVAILEALDRLLPAPPPEAPYAARRAAFVAHRAASLRLLLPVRDHRIAVLGVGPLPFAAALYPELRDFYLPFPQVQELHGSAQIYEEGVHLAVLGRRLRPFYGVYLPTRTEHLELFGTWLGRYAGERRRAVDVGTGSGVLCLMMARAGFGELRATDQNPNAVESLRRELSRAPVTARVELARGDLLAGTDAGWADLVVFNPPWIPGEPTSAVDRALEYADPELFERFFAQAAVALAPEGRVAIVWSTIGQLLRPEAPHPLEVELARPAPRFRLVEKLARRVPPGPGRRRTRERVEVWELQRA